MGKIVTVDFRNDTLFAAERDDGIAVAVKPISDRLGLAWQSQLQRIKDDPILSEGITTIVMPSPGGPQETTCLRLDLVNGWLFKIDSRRVKDNETRARVLIYQRECYSVLFNHFYGKSKPAPAVEGEPNENENTKLRMVTECRQVFGNKAGAQLWLKVGLPIVPAMLEEPRQIDLWDYSIVKSRQEADAA